LEEKVAKSNARIAEINQQAAERKEAQQVESAETAQARIERQREMIQNSKEAMSFADKTGRAGLGDADVEFIVSKFMAPQQLAKQMRGSLLEFSSNVEGAVKSEDMARFESYMKQELFDDAIKEGRKILGVPAVAREAADLELERQRNIEDQKQYNAKIQTMLLQNPDVPLDEVWDEMPDGFDPDQQTLSLVANRKAMKDTQAAAILEYKTGEKLNKGIKELFAKKPNMDVARLHLVDLRALSDEHPADDDIRKKADDLEARINAKDKELEAARVLNSKVMAVVKKASESGKYRKQFNEGSTEQIAGLILRDPNLVKDLDALKIPVDMFQTTVSGATQAFLNQKTIGDDRFQKNTQYHQQQGKQVKAPSRLLARSESVDLTSRSKAAFQSFGTSRLGNVEAFDDPSIGEKSFALVSDDGEFGYIVDPLSDRTMVTKAPIGDTGQFEEGIEVPVRELIAPTLASAEFTKNHRAIASEAYGNLKEMIEGEFLDFGERRGRGLGAFVNKKLPGMTDAEAQDIMNRMNTLAFDTAKLNKVSGGRGRGRKFTEVETFDIANKIMVNSMDLYLRLEHLRQTAQ
jgi:hypothetical protein